MYNLAWAVVLLPLGGFLFAFLPESPRRAAQVCIAFTAAAFGVSMVLLGYRLGHIHDNPYQSQLTFWTFDPGQKIQGGIVSDFHLQVGVLVDALSVVLMPVIALVSTLVQVYATGFIRREDGYTRHATTLAVATFAMLALVASPNLFAFYLFWELLGGCFYVLVGHWWQRPEAAAAARRMFLITRVGDLSLLLALVFLYDKLAAKVATIPFTPAQPVNDPFSFFTMQSQWPAVANGKVQGSGMRTLVILAVLVLVAAAAKSALVPLHNWVSEAFEESPAPVSALLSTVMLGGAGVVLLARMYPLFLSARHMLTVLALVGAVSAVAGAVVALLQNDVRRLLAWSTTSHFGLMFVALGAGAYSAAIFQLIAHAWFKAVLVLAAGSLVVAYRTTDLTEMGGAWRHMRSTSRALLVGSLSAAGVVVLAGFWSLSAITAGIVSNTFPNGGHVSGAVKWLLLIAVAATTLVGAIYPVRMFLVAATGDLPKRRGFQPQRVRELGGRVTFPVTVLAALAAVGGFMGIPRIRTTFAHFVFAGARPAADNDAVIGLVIAGVLALAGAGLAWMAHTGRLRVPKLGRAGEVLAGGVPAADGYAWVADRALLRPSPLLAAVDHGANDIVLSEIGAGVALAADRGRHWQLGRLDAMTLSAVAGVAVVAGAVVLGATGHLPWVGATR